MEKIQILQIGHKDWREHYTLPDIAEFCCENTLKKPLSKLYDMVFLDRTLSDSEITCLYKAVKAYTLFVTDQVEMTDGMAWLYKSRKGRTIAEADIQEFLLYETKNYFSRPYGEKLNLNNIAVAQGFDGNVKWEGSCGVCLNGNFGTELNQAVYWRNSIPVFEGQCLDLWLEYQKDETISIALTVTQIVSGSLSDVQQTWRFSEEELEQEIQIDNQFSQGFLFISIFAKGSGELRIAGIHLRKSRRGQGLFLAGGERYITSKREEVFCYFDPADMKPPLNVYFSGYKTEEGFEGYYLMRGMGCPFLLIAEARLEGGSFYIGTEEYEDMLCSTIVKYMKELGFTPAQVVLSGISMGSFGAMYYGCRIRPYAVLLGKPLLSIGMVAAKAKLHRAGDFSTSLDILKYLCGTADEEAVKELDKRFWDKFDKTDWGESKIIVSYMIEDDYDDSAYPGLLSHIHSDRVQLYGKGFHGRHNDNSQGVIEWFSSRLRQILMEDFQRKAGR